MIYNRISYLFSFFGRNGPLFPLTKRIWEQKCSHIRKTALFSKDSDVNDLQPVAALEMQRGAAAVRADVFGAQRGVLGALTAFAAGEDRRVVLDDEDASGALLHESRLRRMHVFVKSIAGNPTLATARVDSGAGLNVARSTRLSPDCPN